MRLLGRAYEKPYNMFISCFQLFIINHPGYMETTYSLYENNLSLYSFIIEILYT